MLKLCVNCVGFSCDVVPMGLECVIQGPAVCLLKAELRGEEAVSVCGVFSCRAAFNHCSSPQHPFAIKPLMWFARLNSDAVWVYI